MCLPRKFGTEVAPGVFGQIHQHLFCARLDLAIDGDKNTIFECDTLSAGEMGSPENPHGNAYYVQQRPLASEAQACRDRDQSKMRYWRFANESKRNAAGGTVGYSLHPMHSVTPFMKQQSPMGQRALFAFHDLWVTRASDQPVRAPGCADAGGSDDGGDGGLRYPCGEFVNNSGPGMTTVPPLQPGLPAAAALDRPIVNTDIVAWHSFGLHHMPRTEDWPVQPCVTCGFSLLPSGFFDRNPTMDVPPPSPEEKGGSCHAVP